MGKKKDKASKSKKKKSAAEPLLPTETESIEPAEPEFEIVSEPVSETRDNPYTEYVSAQDVMELIDSLGHDLEQIEKSNQSLQQQIARNQNSPQPPYRLFAAIFLILGIGVVTVGYYSARANSLLDETMVITSTRIDNMEAQVESMNASIRSMPADMNRLNTTLNSLSAALTTLDKNVNKVASDVSKINTNTASKPYDPYRMGYNRSPWR